MMIGCFYLGIFDTWEFIEYNNSFSWRGKIDWDDRVVLITIDQKSLDAFGAFPWSRQKYIELINQLNQAQPNVIVLDIIFSESSPEDSRLADAMEQHGRVVLSQAWDDHGEPWLTNPKLAGAAIGIGHILKHEDSDGLIRTIQPEINHIPALALVALETYATFHKIPPLPSLNKPLWINWPSKFNQIPQYSFVDVVRKKIPHQKFKNKIVLVGVTAPGEDVLLTPFDYSPPTGGVFLHATAVNNFLQQNFLKLGSPAEWVTLFLLAGPGLYWAISYKQPCQQLALCVGLSIAERILSIFMLKVNYWIPMTTPIILCQITTIATILRDYPELTKENKSFKHMAIYDGLTQIPNRRRFDEYFQQEWKRMSREKSCLSLILCDIDFFKQYNDSYGHQSGDICLKKVAQAIAQTVTRPADLVARYGGEEFVVVLPQTNLEKAVYLAEQIRHQVKSLQIPHQSSRVGDYVTLSLGVACTIPKHDLSHTRLLQATDEALYQAKQNGRDRSYVAKDLD